MNVLLQRVRNLLHILKLVYFIIKPIQNLICRVIHFIIRTNESNIVTVTVTCTSVSIEFGEASYNTIPQYKVNTVASFTCGRGFNLRGSSSGTCQNSGNWNQIPQCDTGNKNNALFNFLEIKKSMFYCQCILLI